MSILSTPTPKSHETEISDQNPFPGCIWHTKSLHIPPFHHPQVFALQAASKQLSSHWAWHYTLPSPHQTTPDMHCSAGEAGQGTGCSCKYRTRQASMLLSQDISLPAGYLGAPVVLQAPRSPTPPGTPPWPHRRLDVHRRFCCLLKKLWQIKGAPKLTLSSQATFSKIATCKKGLKFGAIVLKPGFQADIIKKKKKIKLEMQEHHVKWQFTYYAVSNICQYLVVQVDIFIRILPTFWERGQYLLSELIRCS